MQPHHLALYRQPGTPAPHPNGTWAAVSITRPNLESDTYDSGLWHLDLESGDLRPLTTGSGDSAPVISPNGQWLAFLRKVDSRPQVHVARVGEQGLVSEPIQLTDHPLGAGGSLEFEGNRLTYLAAVPEEGRYGTDPKVKPGQEPPRHITDFTYRSDGKGFTLDRPTQVFTLDLDPLLNARPDADLATGEVEKPALEGAPVQPVQITQSEDAMNAPVWVDGAILALRSNRNALHATLVHVEIGGEATPIEVPPHDQPGASGTWFVAQVAPASEEGRVWLLLMDFGSDKMDFIGPSPVLASARIDVGAGELSDLQIHTDQNEMQLSTAMLVAAPDGVYVTREHRGTIDVLHFDGEQLTEVLSPERADGEVAVHGGRALPAGVLLTAETRTSVGEVFSVNTTEARRVTNLSARLIHEAGVFQPQEFIIDSADGYPVHGWVTTPAGDGPHPVLLLIHGGPHAAYTPTFFDEVQVYTQAGYAVVFCNPRGSSSYGRAHGRAITGDWGVLDAQDITSFLDGVLAQREDLDPQRVGILGGSYGGYMTALLTTRSDRWAAAIVERGFLDAFSFVGSSDIGWFFGTTYMGEDPEDVARQNPMSHIEKVTTPTLVIHSEEDWRCPIEQGQRWFVGLKRRGVETEFLVFSGEGHELSRSGTPKHRIARFEHILTWWSTHLPVA